MPRPEIKPGLLQELEEKAEGYLTCPPSDSTDPMLALIPTLTGEARQKFKEMGMSGDWLAYQLEQMGIEKDEREKICFAHGQRCFGKLDYWVVAQEQLEKVRAGRPDKPGMLLAEEIAAEVMGGDLAEHIQRRKERRKEFHDKYTKFVE